jgi:hypothetical protein
MKRNLVTKETKLTSRILVVCQTATVKGGLDTQKPFGKGVSAENEIAIQMDCTMTNKVILSKEVISPRK